MLSKDQANAIADDVLSQAQSSRLEGRKAMVRAVPLLYRCRELSALEPWQRAEVVKQATKAAGNNFLLIIVLLTGFATLVGLFQIYKFGPMAPFIIAFCFAALLLRALTVRREIRNIAAQLTLQIHVLVLDAAPEPLDEDVVEGPTPAIHADHHALTFKLTGCRRQSG